LDGLVNVPSAYARFLQGDWELLDSTGQPLGRAQVGDATVWRLKPTLRRLGVEAGDVLTLSFLPAGRSCVLRLGGRELADEDVALFAAPVRDSDDDE
jgi:hypothetical protein